MHPNPSISVSAVVLANDDGQIALVRKQGTTAFMFPGGKLKTDGPGEYTEVREVAQELNVELDLEELLVAKQWADPSLLNELSTISSNDADGVGAGIAYHLLP